MNSVYVRTKLDPEVKTKWLAALRSNEYRQGRSYLKAPAPDGVCDYCCLGVLGEIIAPEAFTKKRFTYETDENFASRPFSWNGACSLPSSSYFQLNQDVVSHLANMNDGTNDDDRSYSFAEIADWIEENL